MNRRSFLGGLTALASVVGLTFGSGAFTTSRVNRDVLVDLVEDNEAYLALEELGYGGRSVQDGGQLRFSIPGVFEETYNSNSPSGVGTDSVYRFGSDADGSPRKGLFAVENHGTQPVSIYSTQRDTEGVPKVRMYDVETGDLLTEGSPSSPLGVGDRLRGGLEIDTRDAQVQQEGYALSLLINAVAVDE